MAADSRPGNADSQPGTPSLDPGAAVASAAAIILVGNVASRLLGLVREQVMAWLFGATGDTDAFVVASAVPTMVYDLLIGGAITAALVPVFVEAAEGASPASSGSDRATDPLWKLVSAILNLVALLLVAVGAALMLLADRLIDVLGAG